LKGISVSRDRVDALFSGNPVVNPFKNISCSGDHFEDTDWLYGAVLFPNPKFDYMEFMYCTVVP
jgi:hypothetical protein